MRWDEWENAASNESLWLDHEEKGLIRAEFLHDYVLRLWFEECNGHSVYDLDFYSLFVTDNPGGVFAPLREQGRFRLVEGNYALLWLNPDTGAYDEQAIDIAPECIRFFCELYGKPVFVAAELSSIAPH